MTGKARAGTDVVSIGYQKYGTLVLLKEKKFLEQTLAPQGVTVRWAQFPAGPPMLQAMMAGALDFGQTGDLPPVFAEASKPGELICTGHEPASGSSEAIIVPAESSILTVNDLAGKRVAVTRWSDAHWLLLAALRKHGMSFHDIRAVYLLPTAARPAFENATVDAWAIWDPYFSAAGDRARSIVTGNDVGTGMEFYMARRQFAEGSPALMEAIRTAVTQCDAWAQANRPEVVGLLSASTGLPPDTVARSIAKISFGLQPMTPDIVSRQRETADIFRKEGLLPS
nr:aliphatic sulfonate ABC transporter substrate-binding protein [Acetobacter oeni]